MFLYLHCAVRIRETSVPPLDDPFIFSSILGPLGLSCLLLLLLMMMMMIHPFTSLSLQLKTTSQPQTYQMPISLVVTKRYEGQWDTSWCQPATQTNRDPNRDKELCDSTSNGTDQYQDSSSNLLTPYREQPQSTRFVVAYPRPAFSGTKRTNYAPTSFDQQVQLSQGHASFKNKEN